MSPRHWRASWHWWPRTWWWTPAHCSLWQWGKPSQPCFECSMAARPCTQCTQPVKCIPLPILCIRAVRPHACLDLCVCACVFLFFVHSLEGFGLQILHFFVYGNCCGLCYVLCVFFCLYGSFCALGLPALWLCLNHDPSDGGAPLLNAAPLTPSFSTRCCLWVLLTDNSHSFASLSLALLLCSLVLGLGSRGPKNAHHMVNRVYQRQRSAIY